MDHPAVRYSFVLVTYIVLQYAIFSQFRIDRVSIDLLLVLAIAAGMQSGIVLGAIVGFACGLSLDLMTITPFGLGAISYLAAGAVGGALEQATVHAARWLTATVSLLSTVSALVLFAVLGSILGRNDLLTGHLAVVIAVVGITNALLIFPTLRFCRWVDPEESRIRTASR